LDILGCKRLKWKKVGYFGLQKVEGEEEKFYKQVLWENGAISGTILRWFLKSNFHFLNSKPECSCRNHENNEHK
jgi:hypothetical protein